MKDNEKMFPKDNSIDWHSLTDADFAKQIAIRKKAQRKLFEKPISQMNNEEMFAAIKAGRFDKPK